MKIRKGKTHLGHSAGNGQCKPNTSQSAGGAIENDNTKDAVHSKAQEPSQKLLKNGESSEDKILAEANTTPDVIKSNSSTPRRKKDPLANLYSSLSPKYIGFSTPKSSSLTEKSTPASDERGCTTRRKKINNNSVNELFISSTDAIGYVRRTNSSNITSSPVSSSDSELAFQRRSFESPIEKLLRKNRTNDSSQTSPSPSSVFEHNFPKAKSKQLERKELMDIKVKVARVESLEMLHKNGINTVQLDQHDKVINIKNMMQSEEEPKPKRRDSENPTFSSDCFQSKEHAPTKPNSTCDEISKEIYSEAKDVGPKKTVNCINSEGCMISSEVDKSVEDINIKICEVESNSKDRVERNLVETDNLVSLEKNTSIELYATENSTITSDATSASTSSSVEISKEVDDIKNKTVNCINSEDREISSEDDKNVEDINLEIYEEESNSEDRVKRKSVETGNFDNLTKDSSIAYNIDEEIVILDTTDESIDNSVAASEDCNQSASESIECVENMDDTTADCQNIPSEPQLNINEVVEENKSCDTLQVSEKTAINITEVPTINNYETRNNKLEENTLNDIAVECNEDCMATKASTQDQDHHMECAVVEYEQQQLVTEEIVPQPGMNKSNQEINAKDVDLEVNMPVNIISINSPSSVSMDSAKGSSVNNDVSWVSFSSGDVFWGQIYSYSFWPCMVCPDPDGKTISTDVGVGRNVVPHVMVHVRFFADNGRRNWVKRDKLFPFAGLENYHQRMLEAEEKYGRKHSIYKAFVVSKGKQRLWNLAIDEANIIKTTSPEKRLNKFNEIYENSKLLNKLERKRRQSLYITLGSTSDIGSLYDSSDNLSLKQPSTGSKRERSISPFSPAFSPVVPKTAKRRKLGEEEEPTTSLNSTTNYPRNFPEENTPAMETPLSQSSFMSSSSQQDEEIFHSNEFKIFFKAMREFVMKQNNDEKLERSLVVAVRNIWALKHINNRQMQARALETPEENDLGSLVVGGVGTCGSFKRLSNRLRNLSLNRSLSKMNTPQLTITQPKSAVSLTQDTQNEEKVKKPINRPIEEVIDDIFNLDNKYLFKGLGRDPICKYCLKPGGLLEKCSKNCQSLFHVDCMEKSKVQKKHPRKTKPITNALLDESTVDKNFTLHITADDVEHHEVPEVRGNDKTAENLNDTSAPNIALTQAATSAKSDNAVCLECSVDQERKCLVCNRKDLNQEEIIHCNIPHCLNSCHPACCKYWPQAKITKSKNKIESFRCPSHVCHTCVSDDPKGKFQNISSSKLTKCIKCPATFHTDSTCIPAGSQILTAAYVICPRHSISKSDQNVNVNWCFICVKGGQVVCCETCPTAVHASCLNIPINSDEGYICEECETGRMPLYGEMVWAKFNNFRWWPAIILPPTEIPNNIMRMSHGSSDFVVRFFGTHDHGWISRRRVYLYLEGDSTEPPKSRTSLDNNYTRGVEEAKRIWEIIKSKKNVQRLTYESKQKLHPQPYVKIKSNRAVPPLKLHIDMEKVSKCECSKDSEEPCGAESNCLNRVLYHECNPKLCPAGDRCQNQMFESRISPKMEVVYMKERGFGLICREPISAGTFVIEYVGEVINDDEFKQRMTQKSIDRDENFYFLSLEKDYIIDAGPKGNLARFMNHSCDPNCETQKWSVNGLNRVGLFAITDIPADTELTFNYHWDELLGSEKKTCYCGAAKCAGQIGEKFKETKIKIDTKAMKSNTKNKGSKGAKAKPLKRLQKKDQISGNTKSFIKIKPKSILKKGKSIEITLLNNTLGNNNEEPITEG